MEGDNIPRHNDLGSLDGPRFNYGIAVISDTGAGWRNTHLAPSTGSYWRRRVPMRCQLGSACITTEIMSAGPTRVAVPLGSVATT